MEKGRIYLIGTPRHGNLGDHAIAKAELQFFKDFCPEFKVVEISGEAFRKTDWKIQRLIKKEDIIVIQGGGFLGTLWMIEEEMVRKVIRFFPDNRVIIFPQTCYYGKNSEDLKELELTRDIYNRHHNLYICAREKKSFDFIREFIINGKSSNCCLVPDMVTYLSDKASRKKRKGILICLRKDKERKTSMDAVEVIKSYGLRYTDKVVLTDTTISKSFGPKFRNWEIERLLKKYRKTELVITDRLHGMLFAGITGTPCIALDNASGKVKGVYDEWLKHLKYIQFTDNVEDIRDKMQEMMEMKDCRYDNSC